MQKCKFFFLIHIFVKHISLRSPEQLSTEFSMSEMSFNPAVSVPKITEPKSKLSSQFLNKDFYEECIKVTKSGQQKIFSVEL